MLNVKRAREANPEKQTQGILGCSETLPIFVSSSFFPSFDVFSIIF